MRRLDGIQRSGNSNPFLHRLEKHHQHELYKINKQEEILWQKKARTDWIKTGDRNTRYYHIKTINRRRRNRVEMLTDSGGNWMEQGDQIKNHVVDFYKQLFTEENNDRLMTHATNLSFPRLDGVTIESLNTNATNEEIRSAIFSMGGLKAPIKDGFHACFYHVNWNCVGEDLYDYVKECMKNKEKIREINNTLVVLILKINQPVYVSQFRPISLCNVTYKTITKVIVNKLKGCLMNIISPFQASFSSGRCIQDNIIIVQEMIHSMRKIRSKKGFMAIKVDLEKAYDHLK